MANYSGLAGLAVLAMFLVACAPSATLTPIPLAPPPPAAALYAGGSNYDWYQEDTCNIEPYGVIYNYANAQPIIDSQLRQLYLNGQRRLHIIILHFHGAGGDTSKANAQYRTVLDSTGGRLAIGMQSNLKGLLEAVHAAGFEDVEVAFTPLTFNNPYTWTIWGPEQEGLFQENWHLIEGLHSLIAQALGGGHYWIDLANESMPRADLSNYAVMLEYTQRMWNLYAQEFGTGDTFGFSIIPSAGTAKEVEHVYGASRYGDHGYPRAYDIHFYDQAQEGFLAMDQVFRAAGGGAGDMRPWVVGEAYYNDAGEAQALQAAMQSTGRGVWWLTQWQASSGSGPGAAVRSNPCGTGVVEPRAVPPVEFEAWQGEGF